MKSHPLLQLKPEQAKAFKKLERAYKACEKLGIQFYNNYGTIGGYDKEKIADYDDIKRAGSILHDGGTGYYNTYEFRAVESWADDIHYFQPKDGVKIEIEDGE